MRRLNSIVVAAIVLIIAIESDRVAWAVDQTSSDVSAAKDGPEARIRFSRHIVPIFSKLGCNAGGNCHGAVKGQNGFRLSLWGTKPEEDYSALLRADGGRRTNLMHPQASLFLLKPTQQIAHGGGLRLKEDSPEYSLIMRWLQAGAPLDNIANSQPQSFGITPEERIANVSESYQLNVEATFADGTTEDITALCSYEAYGKDVATVDENGLVTVHRVGETHIIIRYRSEPLISRVLVPVEAAGTYPEVQPKNFTDEHVLAKLKHLNIHPAELCDDATFLRRASLQIVAEPPTPQEIRAFLADEDPNKRTKKIDELLKRPGHASLWATIFCDIIRPNSFNHNWGFNEYAEPRRFYLWLRDRFAENTPYDECVERILTATSLEGRTYEQWIDEEIMKFGEENAAESHEQFDTYSKRRTLDLYWQRNSSEVLGVRGALKVGYIFLGLRLECAQCHRHPEDIWQQEDVLDFANFFMQVRGARYASGDKQLPEGMKQRLKDLQKQSKELYEKAKQLNEQAKKEDKADNDEKARQLRDEADALRMKFSGIKNATKRFGTAIYHLQGNDRRASVTSPLGTQKSDQFRYLGNPEPVEVPPDVDPRKMAVEWMKDHERNPYLTRAIVNRVWAHYFGRGIVDPPDNLSKLNPATHPDLLKQLADEFVVQGYDLRWLHRTITTSRTYQQSSFAHPTAKDDALNYACFYRRRMMAEVLIDAVNHATGGKVTYPKRLFMPPVAKAIELPEMTQGPPPQRGTVSAEFALEIFGRPKRDIMMMCDCERSNDDTVMHALYLANNPKVRKKISDPAGRVAKIAAGFGERDRQIEELYLWAVNRPPTDDELKTCMKYVEESPSVKEGLEDVMWSLLNTREFLLIH